MDCDKCNALLDDYKRAVDMLKHAVHNAQGASGPDSRLTAEQVAHLRRMCRNASDALMAHWRQCHRNVLVHGFAAGNPH
jgi:hypothetical protein